MAKTEPKTSQNRTPRIGHALSNRWPRTRWPMYPSHTWGTYLSHNYTMTIYTCILYHSHICKQYFDRSPADIISPRTIPWSWIQITSGCLVQRRPSSGVKSTNPPRHMIYLCALWNSIFQQLFSEVYIYFFWRGKQKIQASELRKCSSVLFTTRKRIVRIAHSQFCKFHNFQTGERKRCG